MCKVNILIYFIHSVSKFNNTMGPLYFWQCLLHQMLLSWYLRVTSIKLTKHQSWSEPIDRTPSLPGSDKNCPISGIFLHLICNFTKMQGGPNPFQHHLYPHHWLPRWQSVLLAARKWWNCDHQWYIPARGQHSLPSALVLGIFPLSLSLTFTFHFLLLSFSPEKWKWWHCNHNDEFLEWTAISALVRSCLWHFPSFSHFYFSLTLKITFPGKV